MSGLPVVAKTTLLLISSNVFMTVYYLKEAPRLDYLWAALCLMGAVYFIFREPT